MPAPRLPKVATGGLPSGGGVGVRFWPPPPLPPARSQRPERSGCPSRVRGVGASRLTVRSVLRGACFASYGGHWAAAGSDSASASPAISARRLSAAASPAVCERTAAYCDGGCADPEAGASFSIDEPANSFLPSASTTELALPTAGLFLARWPVTVTVSPIFIELRFQPRRMRP